MTNSRVPRHSRYSLAELLSDCDQFNGVWPSDLALYPTFWRRRLRQGRGIGKGPHYRPWLKVRDFGSKGTSHVIYGIKSRRRHQLFSDYELLYFLLAERRAGTLAIFEQWPILDLPGTLQLASDFRVQHPYSHGFPNAMTVDFVVHEKVGGGTRVSAVAIKAPDAAADVNVLRRLAPQERWCTAHGLPWLLADMTVIPDMRTALESLKFIRWWFRSGSTEPAHSAANKFTQTFLDRYSKALTLDELVHLTAEGLSKPVRNTLHMFRYAAWRSEIPVDVRLPVQLNSPLVLLDAK